MLQAIETRYKGYRFRSRLEARWAVFFDAAGWAWEYEPEGYYLPAEIFTPEYENYLRAAHGDLGDDTLNELMVIMRHYAETPLRYLPDFWLPGENMWAEVKGKTTLESITKMHRLVEHSGIPLLLLHGLDKFPMRISKSDKPYLLECTELLDVSGSIIQALHAARSARFEHGESGAPARA